MKKSISGILALSLIFALAAACGNATSDSIGEDSFGLRAEFIELVQSYGQIVG